MASYNPADRNDSILWARNVLEKKEKYLILDTETTGLKDDDEIIQMAIIDLGKNVLFDTLLKPKLKNSISRDATNIHGIKKSDLIDAPYFETAVNKFVKVIDGKTILIYNAEFDMRLLQQTCYANRCDRFPFSYWCVMKEYSKFIGAWNEYHNDYKYQKLRGGDHTALGDCFATLDTIERMARAKTIVLKKEIVPDPIIKIKEIKNPSEIENTPEIEKPWWKFW